jgi:hypothetical protein
MVLVLLSNNAFILLQLVSNNSTALNTLYANTGLLCYRYIHSTGYLHNNSWPYFYVS